MRILSALIVATLPLVSSAEHLPTSERIRVAVEKSTKKQEACLVSTNIETTAHLPKEQRVGTQEDTYVLRTDGCPSKMKQEAVNMPVGR